MKGRLDVDFIVDTPVSRPDDDVYMFADYYGRIPAPVQRVPESVSILDILHQSGVATSKSDARRMWPAVAKKHGLPEDTFDVPRGFTLVTIGKMRHSIGIFKPFLVRE